jgi:ATP-dependent RNA helicase RhlE
MPFDTLNLSKPLLAALADLGMVEPTPIQQKAFPIIMSGRDVIGIAQTGTGKTYAYMLPLLRMLTYSEQREPRVLIMVPTRELVLQMVTEVKKLTAHMSTRVVGVYGGTNINTQKQALAGGLDILVATPGRLLDLALTHTLSFKAVRHVVIDEMDELLGLGFRPQLKRVFDLLPAKRQHLLFSATMTEDVDDIVQEYFRDPEIIEVTRAGTPLAQIRQSGYLVPNFNTKVNLLTHLLQTQEAMEKVLIFCPSKRLADVVYERLERVFPGQFSVIHGNKSQNFRMNAVTAFEKNRLRGLISTDLMARGVDLSEVTHVINLDVPDEPETYIHRIGRTGRADADGEAIVFVSDMEAAYREAIEALMEQPIPMHELPEDVEISDQLIPDELPAEAGKNIQRFVAPLATKGAFHEKTDKNKKFNKGNKTLWMREKKYSKPIKKKGKR